MTNNNLITCNSYLLKYLYIIMITVKYIVVQIYSDVYITN